MAVQRIVKTLLDDACLLDVICSCMIQKEGQLNASFQRTSARRGTASAQRKRRCNQDQRGPMCLCSNADLATEIASLFAILPGLKL